MGLKKFFFYWLPVVVWLGFIFSLSLNPEPTSVLPQPVKQQVQKEIPNKETVDLSGHIIEFAALGILLIRLTAMLTHEQTNFFPALLLAVFAACIFALSDETIQYFVPGRAFELRDVLTDTIAASLGAAVTCPIFWLFEKRLRRQSGEFTVKLLHKV